MTRQKQCSIDHVAKVIKQDHAIALRLKSSKWRWRGESGNWRDESAPASQPAGGFEGMRESIHNFVETIRTGRTPRANLNVARRVQNAAQLCADAERALNIA